MKLAFKNDKELKQGTKDTCIEIIQTIKKNKGISGAEIGRELYMTSPDVRYYIKLIRENNDQFFVSNYIIATQKGYEITGDRKKLKTYFTKLQGMTHSKVKQLYQLEEAFNIK